MSKEKKTFQLDKKEICITSSQIKQAIDLLINENEILQEEIERLNSIIKEVREYIENTYQDYKNEDSSLPLTLHDQELLEILDKGDK